MKSIQSGGVLAALIVIGDWLGAIPPQILDFMLSLAV